MLAAPPIQIPGATLFPGFIEALAPAPGGGMLVATTVGRRPVVVTFDAPTVPLSVGPIVGKRWTVEPTIIAGPTVGQALAVERPANHGRTAISVAATPSVPASELTLQPVAPPDRRTRVLAFDGVAAPVAGANGALALPLEREVNGRKTRLLAFRSGYGAAFAPPIAYYAERFPAGAQQRVLADPAGGFVIVIAPEKARAFARRVSAAGALGPKVPLGLPRGVGADGFEAAYAPSGDLVVVAPQDGDPLADDARDALVIASLPAGSGQARTAQRVPTADRFGMFPGVRSLVIGADGAIHVLTAELHQTGDEAADEVPQLGVYEGTLGAVARTGTVAGNAESDAVLALRPDGGIAAVWGEDRSRGAVRGAHRDPGGAWTQPRSLVADDVSAVVVHHLVALADGRVGVDFARERLRIDDYAAIVTP